MTRRRHFLAVQRDTRRRRDAQRLGKLFADAVRERREALSTGTPAAPGVPSPAGDGPRQAVAGPASVDKDRS